MATLYDIGDVAILPFTFAIDGVAVNPTTVVVTVRQPNGVRITYTYGTDAALTRLTTGSYQLAHPVTQWGRHGYGVVATGLGAEAGEGEFDVRVSVVNT